MTMKTIEQMRQDALRIFEAGVQAVEAGEAVRRHCRLEGNRFTVNGTAVDLTTIRHIYVVGAGKATAYMAKAIEDILTDRITAGQITIPYGHRDDLSMIRQVEASHPIPDSNGVTGARDMIRLVRQASGPDLVICLISGGGSALTPLPVSGLTLFDKQETIRTLLSCGASIHEINTIRKHLSGFKGGHLAVESFPARVMTILISDVIGDHPDVIASGPTVPDTSTFAECMKIVSHHRLVDRLPKNVIDHLTKGAEGKIPETPKPDHPAFVHTTHHIVASNRLAILAAEKQAADLGYTPVVLSATIDGETREIASMHAAIAREIHQSGHPVPAPACMISGGETTVHITGGGTGGRNQEFVLATIPAIARIPDTVVLSGGTDGRDGPTDAAGAVADTGTGARADSMGMDPGTFLSDNDAYHFFKALNDLIPARQTRTNVMDLRIILVSPKKEPTS
ncbi:MAG: glycerate kinase [Desulfatirhabdiaceae bacterium]